MPRKSNSGRFKKRPSLSDATKKKISDSLKGRKKKASAIRKQRESLKKFYASGNQSPRKGKKLSDKTKRKISLANKGKTSWNKGKKLSKSYRKKLSDSHKGHKLSETTKRKIGRKGKLNVNFGKPLSDATKKKLSKALKGQKAWNKGKKLSKTYRKKLSDSHKGQNAWNKGKKMSANARENNRKAQTKFWRSEKGRKIAKSNATKAKGRKVSDVTRRKVSLANKGKKMSDTAKRKLSRAMKGRKPAAITIQRAKEALTGKPLSKEHKEKIRLHNAKYWLNKHHSKATIEKLTRASTGKRWSAAQHAKMKEIMKNRKHTWGDKISKALLGMKGSWVTEKTKAKLREARLHQVFPVKDTKPERLIQDMLKVAKIKFQKHIPVRGQPDIFIEPNIAIFVDGDYWHANPKFYKANERIKYPGGYQKAIDKWKKDKMITRYLKKNGYDVLRLWEYDINNYPEKCLQKILKVIKK